MRLLCQQIESATAEHLRALGMAVVVPDSDAPRPLWSLRPGRSTVGGKTATLRRKMCSGARVVKEARLKGSSLDRQSISGSRSASTSCTTRTTGRFTSGGAARSAQQCQHPRLLRIHSPLGLTAAGRLRTDLGCRPRLDGARRFALGHAKLLSRASAQQRAGGLAQ
jgi:hypothetical protein